MNNAKIKNKNPRGAFVNLSVVMELSPFNNFICFTRKLKSETISIIIAPMDRSETVGPHEYASIH